ncbi:hypothetical protein SAY87_002573 [Trapa incisa]|uniref:peptidylprolyl isomerase n=2 Tax=Trapa TaxID=22665 RepID=A0AAN7QHZ6_TRANT|nr:hypothetical protein SAY87_002573 [Trapa incisa]KAK4765575.1 hypothetical protein SAY86_026665 [Trapa natans]
MAFWGVEVKPGRPFTHSTNGDKGRLHVSQATMGIGSGTNKSILQCNVGKKSPVFLCTLFPEKNESCQINLEFEEADEVVFSVIGSRSVHITGYYLGRLSNMNEESETFGEDIAMTESDKSIDDEEYEDSFINDDSVETPPSSSVEVTPNKEGFDQNNVKRRRLRKKYQSDESDKEDKSLPNRNVDVKGAAEASDSEDIVDEFFSLPKKNDSKNACKEDNSLQSHNDGEGAKEDDDIAKKSAPKNKSVDLEKIESRKRKKKDQAVKACPKVDEASLESLEDTNEKGSKVKNKQKKKKSKMPENEIDVKEVPADKADLRSSSNEYPELDTSRFRKFPNGLSVEELEPGLPDGKIAVRGKKISVHFVGKIKENGQIFDSNIGKEPFKFRLGKGDAMDGWDDGLEGVRAGGKIRLTVPPSLRKGSDKLKDKNVGPDSWLIYDIEVDSVR